MFVGRDGDLIGMAARREVTERPRLARREQPSVSGRRRNRSTVIGRGRIALCPARLCAAERGKARTDPILFTYGAMWWGGRSFYVVCRIPDETDHAKRWSIPQSEQYCDKTAHGRNSVSGRARKRSAPQRAFHSFQSLTTAFSRARVALVNAATGISSKAFLSRLREAEPMCRFAVSAPMKLSK